MEMLRALKIAIREWENIRVSLEEYGDIGEFDHKNHINNKLTTLPGGITLARKLIEMEEKLPAHGYFTREASYVFTTLASRASERIGLIGSLAHAFGSGYSWIRTGWFDPNDMEEEHLMKQLFFFKIFFPLGGYFNWDFNSSVVKTKLKVILLKFTTWQDEPSRYIQDVIEYKSQLEPLWHGLSLALGFPLIDSSKELRRWSGIQPQN